MDTYSVRMSRAWVYVAVVLVVGLVTGLWFVNTQEVDPAATEPAAFDLFLWVYTLAAMAAALLLCLVAEVVLRLARRRSHSSQ
jgi:hypothetical protein